MVPVSHGCERPLLRGGAAGQWHRHLTWVRAFVLRGSAAGQWHWHFTWVRASTLARKSCGAMVPVSHGCERPLLRGGAAGQWYRHLTWVQASVLRGGAAAQWYRHLAWVRASVLRGSAAGQWYQSRMGANIRPARRRSGAMVPSFRMGAGVRPCAKALWRNGTGISHGCERLPLARRRRIPVLYRRPRCALSGGDIPWPEVCARRCLEGRGVLGRSLEIYATEQRRNICQFARSSMARKRTDPSACGAPTPANSSPT